MKTLLRVLGYILLATFLWKVLTDPDGAADLVVYVGTKIGWALSQLGIFGDGVAKP